MMDDYVLPSRVRRLYLKLFLPRFQRRNRRIPRIPRIQIHVLPSVKRKGALISPKMSSEKKGVNAAEQTLEFVQDLVVRPLLNHFSTWECKPVERIVSTQNASLCYS